MTWDHFLPALIGQLVAIGAINLSLRLLRSRWRWGWYQKSEWVKMGDGPAHGFYEEFDFEPQDIKTWRRTHGGIW